MNLKENVMRKVLTLSIILSFLLFTAVGWAASKPSSDSNAKKPIKIGAILDYTGSVAERGPEVEQTLKLFMEEVNNQLLGRPVQLIIEDGGSTIDVSLDKARKLVERDGVEIIIGPLMGGVQYGIAPYLAEKNITYFSLNNLNPAIVEKYNNGIGFPTMNSMAYSSGGYYLYDQLGFRKVATIRSDYVAGHDYMGSVVTPFKKKGGTIVSEQKPPVGETDFAPYISNILKSDAEAVTVFLAGTVSTALFVKQAHEYKLNKPIIILCNVGCMTEESVQSLGPIMNNCIGIDTYTWRINSPVNNKYVKDFEKKYGKKPISIQTNAYANMKILFAALEKTKSDTSIKALRPAILDLQIEVPLGKYTFSPKGYGIGNQFIMKISEDKGKYYWGIKHVYFGDKLVQ
jgi:branched-chain amino acid transport system substrate-binding protein